MSEFQGKYCKECEEYNVARATNERRKEWVDPVLLQIFKKKKRHVEACVAHRDTKKEFEKTFEGYIVQDIEIEKWSKNKAYMATILIFLNFITQYIIYSNYVNTSTNNLTTLKTEAINAGFYASIAVSISSMITLLVLLIKIESNYVKLVTLLLISEILVFVFTLMSLLWAGIAIALGYLIWATFSITNPEQKKINMKEEKKEANKDVARATQQKPKKKKIRLNKKIISILLVILIYTTLWSLGVLDPIFDFLKERNLWWW